MARAYLEDVTRLGRLEPWISRESQRLGDLLERRTQAARLGLEILSTDLLLIDGETDLTAQVGVRTTPQTPDLPAGSAAVFLRDPRGPLPGTVRAFGLPPAEEPAGDGVHRVPIPLTAQDLMGRGPGLQAVVALRGHEFTTPLTLRQLHGPRIEVGQASLRPEPDHAGRGRAENRLDRVHPGLLPEHAGGGRRRGSRCRRHAVPVPPS